MSMVDDRMKIKAGIQCSATAHDILAMLWETQRKWTLEQSHGKFGEHVSSVLSQPTTDNRHKPGTGWFEGATNTSKPHGQKREGCL